ncbi:terpenoid synthase [Mollisia scopiformis]|uniref:Terpene synthase n=1 Tax=Mollisia scopiformis TaxID=149040 RepID=A0A194X9E1_MOLSC|nr:terpenoid synthase [Mollisia scopiformis]KUJ16791.1 terpenoid synthase [Mollisia scopiformis]
MRPIYDKWSGKLNPHYHAMIPIVNEKLRSAARNEKEFARLKTADFALFGAMWWPTANFDELRILIFWAVWIFLWDDEADEPTGQCADDFETAQNFRQETIQFVHGCLKLDKTEKQRQGLFYQLTKSFQVFGHQLEATFEYLLGLSSNNKINSAIAHKILRSLTVVGTRLKSSLTWILGFSASKSPPTASSPVIENFRVVGEALVRGYTVEQRQNFFEEMKLAISSTEAEQKPKLEGRLPTLEEYWSTRMGISAVGVCIALIELASGIRGPYETNREPSLKILCDETNIVIIIANDILSLKKEMAKECADSLIPLSCLKNGDVQSVLDQAHTDLLAAVARFEVEAEKVLSEPRQTRMSDEELRVFIDGCRQLWVGNFEWSLRTGRYGLQSIDKTNGSFSVVL